MHLYVDQVPCNMLIRWLDITTMVEVLLTRPPYAVGCARRLSVNHVVASTTASWEWCYSDKHLVKAMSLSVIMFFVRHYWTSVEVCYVIPCQQSAQINCNLNPCLSIRMSKRFFDCSLTAADAPKISFVPQEWCRSSRECIAAPDVLTMCRRR